MYYGHIALRCASNIFWLVKFEKYINWSKKFSGQAVNYEILLLVSDRKEELE